MGNIYKTNIKTVQNCAIIYNGGDYIERYNRISNTEFERVFSSADWICKKCGDHMDTSMESQHKDCKYLHLDEYDVIKQLNDMLGDDEDNVLVINEGLEGQCYLALE